MAVDDRMTTTWRERKKAQTAHRIAETGFRLMLERGYEATTLDAIAESAGIARRTFFLYFRSKEDILLAWQDRLATRFRELLMQSRGADTPLAWLADAQVELVAEYDTDQTRAVDDLIRASDRMNAAIQAKYLALERVAFEMLCERWPDPPRRPGLRAAAMASAGVLRLAFDAWRHDADRRPLQTHIRAGYDALLSETHRLDPTS